VYPNFSQIDKKLYFVINQQNIQNGQS